MSRELTRDDLRTYAALRAPLCAWLRDTHARAGLRAGLLGLAGSLMALIGVRLFGFSPILALLHLLIPLTVDGLVARFALRRKLMRSSRSSPPFLSPGHALAFALAVVAVMRGERASANRGMLPENVLPYARNAAQFVSGPAPATEVAMPRWRALVEPVMIAVVVLGLAFVLGLLWLTSFGPLLLAAITVFDAYDWVGLGALAAINIVQVRATWRELHRVTADAPWFVDWLVEPPRIEQLVFWRQYKLLSLMLAMLIAFLLAIVTGEMYQEYVAQRFHASVEAYAQALDARLATVASAALVMLALLYALLLAAPWHARRLVATLRSFDQADP
jgi:hypothetical protein